MKVLSIRLTVKRAAKRTIKPLIVGLLVIALIGIILSVIGTMLKFSDLLMRRMPISMADWWYDFINFGLLIALALAIGMAIERIAPIKRTLNWIIAKLPSPLRAFLGKKELSQELAGRKPAIISWAAQDKSCLSPAIYMGGQKIKIIGKNPSQTAYARILDSTVPIAFSGFPFYVRPEQVYIITNIPLRDWVSNYVTIFYRELPEIEMMPFLEYVQAYANDSGAFP